jgi:hypothetical protein
LDQVLFGTVSLIIHNGAILFDDLDAWEAGYIMFLKEVFTGSIIRIYLLHFHFGCVKASLRAVPFGFEGLAMSAPLGVEKHDFALFT